MKLFQVQNGIATVDFTQHGPSKADIPVGTFPDYLIDELYDAPDDVHIGFGFNYETNEWVRPIVPEGFEYDPYSGAIYPITQEFGCYRQQKLYTYLYIGVLQENLSKKQFKDVTGEDFIPPVESDDGGPIKVEENLEIFDEIVLKNDWVIPKE